MKTLPLYPALPKLPVEIQPPIDCDSACSLCPQGLGVKHVCMPAEGQPGGVLCVLDAPTQADDAAGRFMNRPLRWLNDAVRHSWKGPIAFDHALRCRPSREIRDGMIAQCRGYLAGTLAQAKPQRVLLFGPAAFQAMLGRRVDPFSVRRGYAWQTYPLTPIFLLPHPGMVMRNRFRKRAFERDLEWALTCDVDKLSRDIAWDGVLRIVETVEDAEQAYAEARAAEWIAYDTETAGRMYQRADEHSGEPAFRVLCVATVPSSSEDPWLWSQRVLAKPEIRAVFRRMMQDAAIGKVAQNEIFDFNALHHIGVRVGGELVNDTRLVRKLLEPETDARLDTMQELVGMGGGKDIVQAEIARVVRLCRNKKRHTEITENRDLVEAIRNKLGKPKVYAYGLIAKPVLYAYCGIDTLSTARVAKLQRRRFKQPGDKPLARVWQRLGARASRAVAQIEQWGIHVNTDALEAFATLVKMQHQEVSARIFACAREVGLHAPEKGRTFNPDANADIQKLLFGKLKLRAYKRTKTGYSVDKESLSMITSAHPIVEDVLTYRRAGKNAGTYADPWRRYIRSDGRVHPSINLDGAETGRGSCSEPNLQNIPRDDTRDGKLARNCFAARPGYWLISFDYSQLELRVAAMESRDPNMQAIFVEGVDYHLRTAQMVAKTAWGMDPKQVGKAQRTIAKSINFGVLYGMGPFALAHKIGVPPEEAERTMSALFGAFPGLRRYIRDCLRSARDEGVIWTTWGSKRFRRRALWNLASNDPKSVSTAENGSRNTPIQGKASDFCTFSMVECVEWILEDELDAMLVLPIHDALLFEVREDLVELFLEEVPRIMTKWESHGVPLVVDADIGPAWGSLRKVKQEKGRWMVACEDERDASVTVMRPWREALRMDMAA